MANKNVPVKTEGGETTPVLLVDNTGTGTAYSQAVTVVSPLTTTVTAVTVGTSANQLLSGTPRVGFALYNSGTSDVYVALSGIVTTALFTIKMAPGSYYESSYSGAVTAIRDTGSFPVNITEFK